MRIGQIEVSSVLDGVAHISKHQGGFAKLKDEEWERHAQFLHGNTFRLDLGGLLVRTAGRIALVDLGISRFGRPPYNVGGAFLRNLALHGYSPADITDVIFTHLHIDHVGWASTPQGTPMFPNATYRCHLADWNHFVQSKPEDSRDATHTVLRPIREQLEPWSTDVSLFPGVNVLCAPGHTPGNSVVVLSSGDERGLLLGDVVHCPVQLVEDEWATFTDMDPVLARKTRNMLAAELERGHTYATSCHFPHMAFGRLIATQLGRQWRLV